MADKPEGGATAESIETKIEPDNSLRDQITLALDGDDAVETETEDTAADETADTASETDTSEDTTQDTTEAAETAETSELDDGAAADGDETASTETAEEIDAPAHWALEDQEMFRAQTPEAQKFLMDRSKDMEAAHTKRSQEIAPLRKAVEEWKPYLDQLNTTPEIAFATLIRAEHRLRTGTSEQKRAALGQLAKDYGIPLEAEKPANGAVQDDFLTADIKKAVQPLQDELGTIRQTITERDQMAARAQADQTAETVRQFREAKTEAGTPAHPHFAEVEDEMTNLAQTDIAKGKVPDLADLYERATWSVPGVRAKMLAAQQHAANQQKKRDDKAKVNKAKGAAVSVTGTGATTKEQPKSVRANLEEGFARF